MSYILDALRRAEAERERGAVPSLASQQHSIEVEEEAPPRSRAMLWAVIGLAFALIATLAWTLLGNRGTPARQMAEAPVTPAPAPIAPTLAPAPAPVPQTLAEIAATPSAAIAPAPAAEPVRAVVPTATPTPTPRPVAAPTVKAAPVVALATPKAETKSKGATATAAAVATPASAAAASSEPRIYAQAELPDDIRRDLPRIAINGSSYSGDAASRMVMINGQVFHEGDQLSAGLVLDKIRRRSAVMAYKGYRYEVTF